MKLYTIRPEYVTEEHLVFLDELRESGATNAFGAVPFIVDDFPTLTDAQAKAILLYWMNTFTERHSEKQTA